MYIYTTSSSKAIDIIIGKEGADNEKNIH